MTTTWNINATLNYDYEIKKVDGLFDLKNRELVSYCPINRAVIVIDEKVSGLYLKKIEAYLNHHKIAHRLVVIDGVETEKNLTSLLLILREMEQFGVSRRNEPVIAIGGGVILDVAGLAATIYRRGVPYIRVPTTLLGIIDVSVAAKTGINFEDRRNRLGSYYPPIASFLDKSFLPTLAEIEISSGLGEILKMAVIKDSHLFDILERNGKNLLDKKFDCQYADEVIDLAIQGMKEELENNLWEKNLKRIVDFGHSFSPIIEMRSLVDSSVVALTHGQAVVLDIILSTLISFSRGMMSYDDVLRIKHTAASMALPTFHTSFANPALLFESLQDTVKHRNGDQNLPMPTTIGSSVFVNDLTYDEVVKAAELFKELNA
jgi:3-dehydroquinate synthase